ncbi:hypothetical protein SAMN04489765_0155 [Tsukamurella pulmonis]|uniref:Uncharacterized protein n=1 Tax=Tsukamurella pulmonis TaxID=47312 RepID=A0A1H1AC77_9ACTN|nr:hypothetical protein [Tsukamurella pulmonis]SDQ37272.1 hypothetical protein SAMN04489765_0155 [Tsukamurella pulmonis]SUQ39381.1 Uncharacterised protein [Tsukamurella pulmonis]
MANESWEGYSMEDLAGEIRGRLDDIIYYLGKDDRRGAEMKAEWLASAAQEVLDRVRP